MSLFKATPTLDDEEDRRDLQEAQKELRKLTSDKERRDFFRRKHGNIGQMSDPAINLSTMSWRPPGHERSPMGGGPQEKKILKADVNKNNVKKVRLVFLST